MSISSADPNPRHVSASGNVSALQLGEGGGTFCKGSCASQGHGTCTKPLSQQCNKCLLRTIARNNRLRTQAIEVAQQRGLPIRPTSNAEGIAQES